MIALLGVKKAQPPWYYRALVVCLLLVISAAALDLVFTLHPGKTQVPQGIDDLNSALSVSRSTAPAKGSPAPAPLATASVPAPRQLPLFIPQVPPDPGYSASHPGWECYRSDALEYLVYREQGSVRAVQVLSQARGAITASFLKTCIRLSSGQEKFVTRKSELRSGMKVTTGTLQNGGELVVYRVMPGGEIRGFVVSFPADGQAPA